MVWFCFYHRKPLYYTLLLCCLFTVDVTLQNATIFLNVPFLLPLLEFFTAPPSAVHHQQQVTTTASQTSLDALPVQVLDPAREGRDVPVYKPASNVTATETFSQVDAAALSSEGTQMKIFVHGLVKEPDIVLLCDATKRDSEALILQVSAYKVMLKLEEMNC